MNNNINYSYGWELLFFDQADKLQTGSSYVGWLSAHVTAENVDEVMAIEFGHLMDARRGHSPCRGWKYWRTGAE